jgi:hypothetical protein
MIRIWKVESISMYTLGFCQLESIIILIDVLFSCICNSILQNYDMYFLYLHFKKMYLNAY